MRKRSFSKVVGLAAAALVIAPSAAQAQMHAHHKSVPTKTAQQRLMDAQVAAAVAQMRALHAEAVPNDVEAHRAAINAEAAANQAQIASDKDLCANRQALAVRMRSASVQDQNYLMTLCGRR